MSIVDILQAAIKTALQSFSIDATEIALEHPADLSHGDYSTNVALAYAKQLKTNPKVFAEKIKAALENQKIENIEKIEIAGPGFINFYLAENFFTESIGRVIKEGESFGKNKVLHNTKTLVEFTDPNPFKEFHIGHLMSNTIGESISRIIAANGAEVKRACYQGDVGLHVAKAVWYMVKQTHTEGNSGISTAIYNPSVFIWGKAYASGDRAYNTDQIAKEEIIEINRKIYAMNPVLTYPTLSAEGWYKRGRDDSLRYFETIYKKLGTKFDFYFFESETGVIGKELVEKNTPNIFEKSDGAIIFRGEQHDPSLHTRVFINKEGLPTYEAKELGLAGIKYKKYPYDTSVVITGNEVNEYFRVLLKAMELVYPELAKKTHHVSHGMLRLPTGKMSSRTGNVITAESLISEIEKVLTTKIAEREYSEAEKKDILEKVSVGSLKYSILKQATGSDIIFDFDKSISFEGDSGPYLQYSCVRARSIVAKAKEAGVKAETKGVKIYLSPLEKMLYRYPEVVARAGSEYAPHHIATYLIELAAAFNNYYANNLIVNKDDATSPFKVALTLAFSIVMSNGLNLLGIQIPEKM